MSDENNHASDSDFNNEVFQIDEEDNEINHDDQWINELRLALERGCDLGSIRNIGKCRPLTEDLRLAVWKVRQKHWFFFLIVNEFVFQTCLDINDTNEYDYIIGDVFDLPEQNLIREDALSLVRKYQINKIITKI